MLSVLHTWPLARDLSGAIQDDPDITAGLWSLNELALQIGRDPAHLMDGNIFYPFPRTIAILDHQLASALLAAPLAAAGAGSAFLYNVMIIVTFFLNAVCAWLLVRRLTGSEAAGLVGGCAFAFSTYHAYHLPQAHLLATQWLPLALLMLHLYFERPTWPRWGGLAGATMLVAFSSWHVAIIGAVAIGIVALWTMVADPVDLRRRVLALAMTALLCGIALLPLARVYQQVGSMWPPRTGEGRETLPTLTGNSATLGGLVSPSFNSRAPYAEALRSATETRSGVFPGIVVILLTLPALALLGRVPRRAASKKAMFLRWALRSSSALVLVTTLAAVVGGVDSPVLTLLRPLAPFALFGLALTIAGLAFAGRAGQVRPHLTPIVTYTALAVAGAFLAMGPNVSVGSADAGSGLWRLDLLPIRLMIRAPDRLSLLLVLGVAVLAGFGTLQLLSKVSPGRRAVLVAAILAALNADLAFRMTSLRPVPETGEVERWLTEVAEDGAVIEYPLDRRRHPWALYLSQVYDRRTVNGAGYLYPWEYKEIEEENDLEQPQLQLLWEHFHPRYLVVRTDKYRPRDRRRVIRVIASQPEALQTRARFGDNYVLELVDRGRDTELYRRWPRSALADKRAMMLDAQVSSGRDDTIGELVVSLNGEILMEARGEEAVRPASHEIDFGSDHLVRGINVFHIWADYRFSETAVPHPVGNTGVSLPADVLLRADRERSRVQVNGRVFRPDKGYFLVVLDPYTGEIVNSREFNVSWYVEDSEAMADFIREIPPGSPVLVVTEFDASRELTESAVAALRDLGIQTDLRDKFQMLHAAIGVKGAPPGSALEATDPVTATLELGEPDLRQVQILGLVLRD